MSVCTSHPRSQTRYWMVATTAVTALALLVGLLGCGSSAPKLLFAVGLGTPNVATFAVDGRGALTQQQLLGAGATPTAVVVDPQRKFAFVSNSAGTVNPGAISQYTVNNSGLAVNITTVVTSNGSSTQNVGPIPAGIDPVAMVIDGSGKFLFAANKVSNNISVYTIDRSTGVLTEVKASGTQPGSPFTTAAGPSSLAIAGNALFVANQGAHVVSVFTIDQTTGVLTASGTPVAAGTSPTALAVDGTGKFLYVADSAANAVLGFTIGSNQLSPMASPFPTGTTPVAVTGDSGGRFVYVANSGSGDVSAFSIGSGGVLAPIGNSPFKAGTNPAFVAFDSSGFLFVANAGSNDISVFNVGSDGSLQPASGSPFAANVLGNPVGLMSIN